MATDWDLRGFINGLDDLEDAEKEHCFSILHGQGFGAAKKRRAFLALDINDLKTAGISDLCTRKVLRLAIEAVAAGLGVGSATGAAASADTAAGVDTHLYNNVTLFVPCGLSKYGKRDRKKLSQKKFRTIMRDNRVGYVLLVDKQPSQLLTLCDCIDTAVDIDDVQLQDGMQLAVVVDADDASRKTGEQVKTIQGWVDGQISADEYKCAEWALLYLASDQGAMRWCFKHITGKVNFVMRMIEIDGMAYSVERVVLVERKPHIAEEFVRELSAKAETLKMLVEAGAPNTAMLRNLDGLMKPLEIFLMADNWADDPGEVAACAVLMEKFRIQPLLPTGDGGYAPHDSCGRWPVDDSIRRRGQDYLRKAEQRGQVRSDAGMDASMGSGAGGASGPNSAVGIGRLASSQQAACSPAHPPHHLHAHEPLRATSGAGLRRSLAPVCPPLHLHPRPQHRPSMPSMRRL